MVLGLWYSIVPLPRRPYGDVANHFHFTNTVQMCDRRWLLCNNRYVLRVAIWDIQEA